MGGNLSRKTRVPRGTLALVPNPKDAGQIGPSEPRIAPELPTVDPGALSSRPTHGVAAQGLSRSKFTRRQIAKLLSDFDDSKVGILPSGECYVSNLWIRDRLSRVFGPGAWGLDPRSTENYDQSRGLMLQTWALMIEGVVVAVATGECKWVERNARMTYGDAIEGTKSNALNRCAKDLGIGAEVRDPDWAYQFKLRCAVLVNVRQRDGKMKLQWRKYTSQPLSYEQDIDPRSPNKDQYTKPRAPERAAAGRRPQTTVDDSADRQQEDRQPQRQLPSGEGVIAKAAIGQLQSLCETHKVSEEKFKAYLFGKWGIKSRTKIKKIWWTECVDWIKRGGEDAVEGEVVGQPGQDDIGWGQ